MKNFNRIIKKANKLLNEVYNCEVGSEEFKRAYQKFENFKNGLSNWEEIKENIL